MNCAGPLEIISKVEYSVAELIVRKNFSLLYAGGLNLVLDKLYQVIQL